MPVPDCPPEQLWRMYLSGSLPGRESTELDDHLGHCSSCMAILDRLSKPSLDLLLLGDASAPTEAPSVAGYTVSRLLGAGGMGVVYLAEQHKPKRPVALKTIRGGRLGVAQRQARFRIEAEAVAHLQHPNIVQVFEVGEHDGGPYFAMEHLEGGSLSDATNQPTTPRAAAELVRRLADAIQHAHDRGVIHRDLKPGNVLFTRDGLPKVCDFGLARLGDGPSDLTQDGPLGTPSYMAPEQAAGRADQITVRTDVYALGAVLYELLTGRPPFQGQTRQEVLNRVCEAEALPPRKVRRQVPHDLDTITVKCLQKDPKRRYGSAAELADDLRRFSNGEPIRARPSSSVERVVRWARRHPVLTVSIVFALALPSATAGVASWYGGRLQSQAADFDRARTAYETEKGEALQAAARSREAQDRVLRAADFFMDRLTNLFESVPGARLSTVRDSLELAGGVYDDLEKSDPSPEVLAAAGRTHSRLGDAFLKMNDTRAALEHADAALDAFHRLVSQNAEEPAYRVGLADALEVRGRVALVREGAAEALKRFTECRDLRASLADQDGRDASRQAALAETDVWLGTALQAQGKWDEARAAYQTALERRERLAGAGTDAVRLRDVADSHERLANLALQNHQNDMAADHYRKARAILDPLVKGQSSDLQLEKFLNRVDVSLAQTYLVSQRAQDAVVLLQETLPRTERGVNRDPDDLDQQLTWFRARSALALQQFQNPPDQAGLIRLQKDFKELRELGGQLSKKDPANHVLTAELAGVEMAQAAVDYQRGNLGEAPADRFSEAVEAQKSALQRLEGLVKADPTNKEWSQALEQGRQLLEVLQMRQTAATAPHLPGLADPEYLAVVRQETGKARDRFKAAPSLANAADLANDCLTLAAELRKGDYKPYLAEARSSWKRAATP